MRAPGGRGARSWRAGTVTLAHSPRGPWHDRQGPLHSENLTWVFGSRRVSRPRCRRDSNPRPGFPALPLSYGVSADRAEHTQDGRPAANRAPVLRFAGDIGGRRKMVSVEIGRPTARRRRTFDLRPAAHKACNPATDSGDDSRGPCLVQARRPATSRTSATLSPKRIQSGRFRHPLCNNRANSAGGVLLRSPERRATQTAAGEYPRRPLRGRATPRSAQFGYFRLSSTKRTGGTSGDLLNAALTAS